MYVYLGRRSGGNPSLERAGCPSCLPQAVSVVDFHHPYRTAWNKRFLGYVPELRSLPHTGRAAIPRRQFAFALVRWTPPYIVLVYRLTQVQQKLASLRNSILFSGIPGVS